MTKIVFLAIQTKTNTLNRNPTSKGIKVPSHHSFHQPSTNKSFIMCKSNSTDQIC